MSFDDPFFRRGQRCVREGQPTGALSLKEPFLDVARQCDTALLGFVAQPGEFVIAHVSGYLSPHSSRSLASLSRAEFREPSTFSPGNLIKHNCPDAASAACPSSPPLPPLISPFPAPVPAS